MKKFLSSLPLSAAALVALSFAACTDSDVVSDGSTTTGGSVNENAIMFSTYMGTAQNTRAQYAGDINTDVLKYNTKNGDAATVGFGVFAYYTGQNTNANVDYTDFRQQGTGTVYPNFMYNQHVTYNANSGSDITQWEYTPIKYWPNEVSNNATKGVDDQVNDKDNDPATTTMEYGGQVSFFAYAPYVEVSQTTATNIDGAKPTTGNECTTEGTSPVRKSGIIALSGNQYVGSSDPKYYSDPYVHFGLPISKNSKYVDLLWGTKGGTNQDVNNEGNTGVKGEGATGASTDVYSTTLLNNYWTNADLRKQTTTGKIEFLFKHALSKVGGVYQGNGEGDDEDPKTATNGLMIVLDLDNEGEETGGKLEPFDPALNAKTKYKTKVTVKDIQIEAKMLAKDGDKKPSEDGFTKKYYTTNEGYFNLATGQWDLPAAINSTTETESSALTINHNIKSLASTLTDYSGELSDEIAEPASVAAGAEAFANTLPIGVTTVKKNVYKEATNALVFFPGTYPVLTITIDYIVRTYDPNLAKGYSDVGQKIKKTLTFDKVAELNKMYNILIHLGLTSVKFTAEVSDWDVNSTTATTINDEGEPVEIEEVLVDHDVYEPINVKNPVTALKVDASGTTNVAAVTDATMDNPIIAASDQESTTTLTVTGTYTTPSGSNTATVTNNVSYTSNASWVTVSPDGVVSIAANNANSQEGRQATITIKYGEVTQKVKVQQYSKYIEELTITAKPDGGIKLLSAGGTYDLKHATNGVKVEATTDLYYNNTDMTNANTKSEVTTDAKLTIATGATVTPAVILTDGKTLRYGNNVSGSDHTVVIDAKYKGATTSTGVTLTQGTGTLESITTNLGSAQTVAYTGGTLTVNKVYATYNDAVTTSDDFTVEVTPTTTNTVLTWAAAGTDGITTATASGLILTVSSTNNNTDKTLSGTLTVKYTPETGAGEYKTSPITVTQSKKQ